MTKVELTASFQARDESGHEHTIHVYHTISRAGDDGVMSMKTAGGGKVERVSKGVYRMADARVLLRSPDPDAP
jgi:hypothetical protein